ncbi:STAS domain-containing protein [Chloroflexota bacterium]
MEVFISAHENCDVVAVSGKIDHSNQDILNKAINDLIDAGHFRLVLDLSKVDYMSSAGLRIMVTTQNACRNYPGGDLFLSGVPKRIKETLELTEFVRIFKIYEDNSQAVAGFSDRRLEVS